MAGEFWDPNEDELIEAVPDEEEGDQEEGQLEGDLCEVAGKVHAASKASLRIEVKRLSENHSSTGEGTSWMKTSKSDPEDNLEAANRDLRSDF